jgi:hypothetical protein
LVYRILFIEHFMMLEDNQGLTVSTDSPIAIAAINRFIDQALGYGCETEAVLLQGNVADRECVLIHAYLAAHYLSQETMASRNSAIPHLKAAQGRLGEITERERLFVQAIAAWAKGAIDQAIELHETLTDRYPQDLVSVQQGQYHYFYQGNFAGLLRIAEKVLPDNRENHLLVWNAGIWARAMWQLFHSRSLWSACNCVESSRSLGATCSSSCARYSRAKSRRH